MHEIWMAVWQPGEPILEKVIRTALVYVLLLALLRLAGKRELGQLNAFDLVVLLLLSNTVQDAIIGADNSFTGGAVGAATLIAINALVVRFLYSHPWLDHVIEGRPEELIRHGRLLRHNLRRQLISVEELAAAARRQGISHLHDVESCRLEIGGTLTFIVREPTLADQRHRETLQKLEAIERRLVELTPPEPPPART